jgi:predicted ATP-dependent protease
MIPESNVKDLMLRKDVVEAVKNGQFHIYAVRTIDEGIEILSGKEAGELGPDGLYPKGTINHLVNEKLKALAEGLKKFGGEEEKKEEPKGKGKKSKKQ